MSHSRRLRPALRNLGDRSRGRVINALAESLPEETHDAIVAGAISGCDVQGLYQSEPSLHVPSRISFFGLEARAIDRGVAIGHSINHTKRLVNEPPSVLYPASFAEKVEQLVQGTALDIEIWDQQRLQSEGCRAMLAVGAGSDRPPRLVILRYSGGGDEPPIALVGKGVTFDSGGLSLKPSDAMADMKCDMAGAATVVGVMHAIASLGAKTNVIGFLRSGREYGQREQLQAGGRHRDQKR